MNKLTVIKPKDKFHWRDLIDLWQYRELLYFLTWRNLKIRYKQTVIGVAWIVFQPVMSMIVFTVVFGNLAHIQTDPDLNGNAVPYPIFVFTGLLFWQFFSSALTEISSCIVDNQNIISKIYFPRVLLPVSIMIARLVDFAIAFLIFLLLLLYYNYLPNLITGLLVMPFLILISCFALLGIGLLLSALNVKYRDVRQVLPYFIQLMLFLTPVVYSSTFVGYDKAWIFSLNPIASVIKLARSAFLGVFGINWLQLSVSLLACVALFVIGWAYFRKIDRETTDIV